MSCCQAHLSIMHHYVNSTWIKTFLDTKDKTWKRNYSCGVKLPCGSPKFHLKIIYKLKPLYSWFFIASLCGLLSPVFHNKHLLVATACIICNSFRRLCWWDPFYSQQAEQPLPTAI